MRKLFMFWLICIVALAACVGPNSTTLNGTSWRLQQIDGAPIATEVNATIVFSDGQFSGNGGCNSYGGTYTTAQATVTFTLNQMTMMACMGAGGDVEQLFMATLPQTTSFIVADSNNTATQLTLLDDRRIPRLVFVRIQQ